MKARQLTSLVAPCVLIFCLLTSCLSKQDPLEEHFFTLPLSGLAGVAVPGTRPLRFDRMQSPPLLSSRMLWRVSETEVASDDINAWAVHPVDVLEQRLRDLLFARAGYRESLGLGDPLLSVRVVTMEGDAGAQRAARIELVADYWSADGTQHREHFRTEQELDSLDPVDLSHAMAKAIEASAASLAQWVEERE